MECIVACHTGKGVTSSRPGGAGVGSHAEGNKASHESVQHQPPEDLPELGDEAALLADIPSSRVDAAGEHNAFVGSEDQLLQLAELAKSQEPSQLQAPSMAGAADQSDEVIASQGGRESMGGSARPFSELDRTEARHLPGSRNQSTNNVTASAVTLPSSPSSPEEVSQALADEGLLPEGLQRFEKGETFLVRFHEAITTYTDGAVWRSLDEVAVFVLA